MTKLDKYFKNFGTNYRTVEFNNYHTDQLIKLRAEARANKNWQLSDDIRNFLDAKQVFIFDTANGQEIYCQLPNTTRDQLVAKININNRAEKLFDAWLYSTQKSGGII